MAKIPQNPEEIFEEFTQDLRRIYGSELKSVVLYGSGAKGEYVAGKSDLNFLIVLTDQGIENLDKALEIIPKWRKRNVAVPLFLTRQYIDSALDTFPMEFLDMQKFHKIVFGADVLSDLQIDNTDLRHQIERELRSKLIYLREGFLGTGHDREQLHALLAVSVSTISAILGALLHLQNAEIPNSKDKVFEQAVKRFNLDSTVFLTVLNIRKRQWRGSLAQVQEVALKYISQLRSLVTIVDKM